MRKKMAMEKMRNAKQRLREAIVLISKTKNDHISALPLLERFLLPLLAAIAPFYKSLVVCRDLLYRRNILRQRRLPVPVISVGNVTWGGTGKTPMVEFLARHLHNAGIAPLILTRGYMGGDEALLLENLLSDTSAIIGVGPNRAEVAEAFFKKYHVMATEERNRLLKLMAANAGIQERLRPSETENTIGVVVLDDGMQHRQVARNLELVMVNSLSLWGNERLIPCGPLREPLHALERADVVILHHANLVPQETLRTVKIELHKLLHQETVFLHSQMVPKYFFLFSPTLVNTSDLIMGRIKQKLPLAVVEGAVLLLISGIACVESLFLVLKTLGAFLIDHIEFTDHHTFNLKDVCSIQQRASELKHKFGHYVAVIISEKDYFRNSSIWANLTGVDLLILHSSLSLMDEPESSKIFNRLLSCRLNF